MSMKGLGTWGLGLGTLGLGLAVLLLPASPAAAQSPRERQMRADLRMLQEQTQLLQQQLTAAIEQLATTLKTINSRIDDQNAMTRKSFADQKLAVDQFGGDLRIVRERIDENTVRITSLAQEVEALRLAIPQYQAAPSAPVDPIAAARLHDRRRRGSTRSGRSPQWHRGRRTPRPRHRQHRLRRLHSRPA